MSEWSDIQAALDKDEVVLLPTETVYGLAAKADNPKAIAKIYAIKGRDFDKPLAVCVKDIKQASALAQFDTQAHAIAEQFWPGSLTLVLKARTDIKLDRRVTDVTSGVRTIALRCPKASWAKNLKTPIALTSANRSGQPDCTDYSAAMKEFGRDIAASIPATTPLSGAPSTILRIDAGKLTVLRQGELKVSV